MSAPEAGSLRPRRDYGGGVYRRHIRLRSSGDRVEAALEDDFHRFELSLRHDGRCVTALEGIFARFPWTTCPGALSPLRRLVGMPLACASRAAHAHVDPRTQCTHLLDLAGLAVAHAAAGRAQRSYRIEVPDRSERRTRPRLLRDGRELLCLELRGADVLAPEPFAGRRLLGGGFARWAESALDPELAEAALLLQRCCAIAMGRLYDMDAVPGAWAFGALTGEACHTFRSGTVDRAARVVGSARDFTAAPEDVLRPR